MGFWDWCLRSWLPSPSLCPKSLNSCSVPFFLVVCIICAPHFEVRTSSCRRWMTKLRAFWSRSRNQALALCFSQVCFLEISSKKTHKTTIFIHSHPILVICFQLELKFEWLSKDLPIFAFWMGRCKAIFFLADYHPLIRNLGPHLFFKLVSLV